MQLVHLLISGICRAPSFYRLDRHRSTPSVPIAVKVLVVTALVLGASSAARATWSAGSYPDLQTTYSGDPIRLAYQGAPPLENNSTPTWSGYPANDASTQQVNFLLGTQASFSDTGSAWTGEPTLQMDGGTADGSGTVRAIWVWANRRNDSSQPNYTCNLIAPTAPNGSGIYGTTLRRTAPLPWEDLTGSSGPYYQATEVVVDETDGFSPHHWWRLKDGSTQASASATPPHSDTTNWEDVYGNSDVVAPSCRFEYKTFASAIASNIVQAKWLAGEPAYEWTGSSSIASHGFIDIADAYGLDVYSFTDGPANIIPAGRVVNMADAGAADDIFTLRCLAVDKALGANTNFAVKGGLNTSGADGVYLQINRLADVWDGYAMAPYVDSSNSGGASWEFGQIVRDNQSLLPDSFAQYDGSSYTASLTGLSPAAFSGSFVSTYNNGHLEKYVELNSAGTDVIRQRYLLPADTSNYLVTVTGWFTNDISASGNSRILLKATGLDSLGNLVTAGTASVPQPAVGSGLSFEVGRDEYRQFKFQHVFNASGTSVQGIAATAFPAGADLLRFGVFVQNGTVQLTSILVQKVNAIDPLPAPTYWQCVNATGCSISAPANGTDFTTFSAARTAAATGTWQPQELALQLDYEVSDSRPIDAAHDSVGDANVIYLFGQLRAALAAEGYRFFVYTNDIDQRNGVAIHNSLTNENLDDVLDNVDKLIPVADEANYRGNSVAAALGASYDTLRYTLDSNGDYTTTERSNFSVDKIGFALPLSGRYLNDRAPVTGVSTKTISGIDYYQISVDTSVAPSGAVQGGFIHFDGFAPPYDTIFNGKTFHVRQGGANIVIDQIVDYTDPQYDANGVLVDYGLDAFLPSLPIPTYQGGGIAGGGGATKADFQYAVGNFIDNADPDYQVKHWDMWRLYATQKAYVSAENPTYLDDFTQTITGIRLAGDGHTLILIADVNAPWISDFPHKTDFKGRDIYSVTLAGFTAGLAPLNGCTFEPVFTGTDPDGLGYNVHRYALRGFDGAGFGLTAGATVTLSTTAKATDASSLDVNRKIGTIAFGATP